MINPILEEMNKLGADVVMFHKITHSDEFMISGTFGYYTREQVENGELNAYPKSGRTYYKLVDGQRVKIENVE